MEILGTFEVDTDKKTIDWYGVKPEDHEKILKEKPEGYTVYIHD